MDIDDKLDSLISWTMVVAMNTSVLVAQQQMQRPLTPDEIDNCQARAGEMAGILRDGFRDGYEAAMRGDDWPPENQP